MARRRGPMSGAAVVVAVLVALLPATGTQAAVGRSFTDVPPTHPFYEEIEWMIDAGITQGFPDDTFRPALVVSRQAEAAFLYRLWTYMDQELDLYTPDTPTFSDVSESHPFFEEIEWAAAMGIVNGYDDGTFKPTAPITRQAEAALLQRLWVALGQADVTGPDPGFTDVPSSHVFFDEIAWLAASGITEGYADGTFRPVDPVTRQTKSAFLYRLWTEWDDRVLVVDVATDAPDAVLGDGVCATAGAVCTLRAAVDEANDLDGRQTIRIIPALQVELSLAGSAEDGNASGDLDIADDVDVVGGDATVIDANAIGRVFQVLPGVTARLAGIEITGGSDGQGGGLLNAGGLRMEHTTIADNRGTSGGGMLNLPSGVATIVTSTIEGNLVSDGAGTWRAGGIDNAGDMLLFDVTVTDNRVSCDPGGVAGNCSAHGGGILNTATLDIVSSEVTDNIALCEADLTDDCIARGGGIYNEGTATVSNVRLAGNDAQGVDNGGDAVGRGGGLYNAGGEVTYSGGIVELNSAIGNSSGGGFYAAAGEIQWSDIDWLGNAPDNCAGAGTITPACPT